MTDEDLVAATRADPEAFGELYRRHVSPLLAWFRARTYESDQALDLTAETFARALQHASSFDGASGQARAWLFTIARNLLLDSYRRGQVESDGRRRLRMEPLEVTEAGFERVESTLDAARMVPLDALKDELSPEQVEAITGRVIDERSYERLAQELACSPQVVRQHVSRGLRKLRRNREVSA